MAKPQRKAQQKLEARIKGYEQAVANSKTSGREYKRPGSMQKGN